MSVLPDFCALSATHGITTPRAPDNFPRGQHRAARRRALGRRLIAALQAVPRPPRARRARPARAAPRRRAASCDESIGHRRGVLGRHETARASPPAALARISGSSLTARRDDGRARPPSPRAGDAVGLELRGDARRRRCARSATGRRCEWPAKRTRSAMPSARASASSSPRSGPSPTSSMRSAGSGRAPARTRAAASGSPSARRGGPTLPITSVAGLHAVLARGTPRSSSARHAGEAIDVDAVGDHAQASRAGCAL